MTRQPHATTLVYVGAYTEPLDGGVGRTPGIAVFRMDLTTGALTRERSNSEVDNPSYLTLDPLHRHLYVVGEGAGGYVHAFQLDPANGALTYLNGQPSGGDGPAHLSMDRSGRWLLVANYGSGSIAVLPTNEDGSLGSATEIVQHHGHSIDQERQGEPHAHWIAADPANRFVLVADLGIDKVMIYRLDEANGTLSPNDPPWLSLEPGSGPRHLAFHPNGAFVYVINELASTLVACRFDPERGDLQPIQSMSTLPDDATGSNTTAAVRITPAGRFVYGSNRGHDSIVMFSIDPATGMLLEREHEPTHGHTPRDFNIDPTGSFLVAANQDSNTLVTFRIDPETGKLSRCAETTDVMRPVCIVFGGIDM